MAIGLHFLDWQFGHWHGMGGRSTPNRGKVAIAQLGLAKLSLERGFGHDLLVISQPLGSCFCLVTSF